jgi:DNA-binding response OmpR family regulator
MNKKIMIVDDDKEFLEELKETLSLGGYDLIAVDDPTMVSEKARSIKPDILLLDLKMPKMSGFQVADELKYLSECTHLPIIAMSAFIKDDYAAMLNICGIKYHLKKPFHPLDVIAKIEEVLAQMPT